MELNTHIRSHSKSAPPIIGIAFAAQKMPIHHAKECGVGSVCVCILCGQSVNFHEAYVSAHIFEAQDILNREPPPEVLFGDQPNFFYHVKFLPNLAGSHLAHANFRIQISFT